MVMTNKTVSLSLPIQSTTTIVRLAFTPATAAIAATVDEKQDAKHVSKDAQRGVLDSKEGVMSR